MPYEVTPLPDAGRDATPAGCKALAQWLDDQADQLLDLVTIDVTAGIAVFNRLPNSIPL